jgi:dTDP-L-rhamnose 4-epimerase
MKILVTGGAGFIGSHLVDGLVREGHQVRVLDLLIPQVHSGKTPAYLPANVDFILGDVCDRDIVARCLEGMEAVFHLAAEVGVGQSMYEPERYMRVNTMGTTILLDEISKRRKQVRKMVVASSMSIYGEGEYDCVNCGRVAPPLRSAEQLVQRDWEQKCPNCSLQLKPLPTKEEKPLAPTSVYAISKQDQEQLFLVMGRAYGIPAVALRYFNAYGSRQALSNPYTGLCAIFASRLLNDQPPLIFEDGEQLRDLVHIDDIVQATILALKRPEADFQAMNIASGRILTVKEIAAMLARELGKNIMPKLMGQYREGDIRHCFADITRAKRLLGYQPRARLEDGVRDLVAWVKGQIALDRVDEARKELDSRDLVH